MDVEELLIEILVRLPPTCLPRFQLVSKKWLSIISTRLHSRRLPAAVNGLFFAHPNLTPPFPGPLFVPLKGPDENPQHTHKLAYRLNGLCGGGPIVSLHSCNGLLCVWSLDENGSNSFYAFNPTTNQRRCIPHPPLKKRYEIIQMDIAFDPSKSHYYNLVCVYKYKRKRTDEIGFSVFSSESRVWRKSDERLGIEFYHRTKPGAFLNGAIHWYIRNFFVCFDVDDAWLRPMPPSPLEKPGKCVHFGECGGHLHFVEEQKRGTPLMNVFEMKNDYSHWILKYQVDLTYMQTRFFPNGFPHVAQYGFPTEGISIHFFVVDNEGKGGLVISFPRKFILYHLHDMGITQLTEWPELFSDFRDHWSLEMVKLPPIEVSLGRYSSCTHIETLAYV